MRHNKILLLYITVFAFMNFASAQSEVAVQDQKFDKMLQKLLSHDVREIVPNDIDATSDVILLDAREKKEYDTSHIENAIWIGYDDFNVNRVSKVPKDREIVVYCSVGYRSEKIAEKLEKDGYTNVSNLYGGIFEWVNEGNKVQDVDGETTNVHTFNKDWSKWLFKGKKIY